MTIGSRWIAGVCATTLASTIFACASTGEEPQAVLSPSNRQNVDAGDIGEVSEPPPEHVPFELPADGSLPKIRKVSTEPIGRLTNTRRNPIQEVGISGTDLGATFERDGKLVFVFGDTWIDNGDSFAVTTHEAVPTASDMPQLTWITAPNGRFLPPRLPNVDLGGMNVPMEGIPVGDKTFVFFTTGWNGATGLYSRSVLAEMQGLDVGGLRTLHNVESKKFINVSAVVEGETAYLYGSGDYRKSPVYLAKVDVSRIGDRSAWTYYREGSGASAVFQPGEGEAAPLVDTRCVGELSVRKWEKIGLYFMTYNCGDPEPRGITMRWARSPEGPWSEPLVVLDPGKDADHGYEHYIHARQSVVGHDDGLSDRGRNEEWGGEYAPYLIPRYFTEEPNGVIALVYTLSTWNPYQVSLVRTRLALENNTYAPPPRGAGLPKTEIPNAGFTDGLAGWEASGDGFGVIQGTDGRPWVTTFVGPKGDGVVGTLSSPEFTVDATTSEIRFVIHGGDARVVLMHGEDIVRTSHPRRSNETDIPVVWTVSEFRGEKLRIVIDDSLTGVWGFITVSGFEIR